MLVRGLAGGRFAHGWALVGPRGVGKATLAYRTARRLLSGGAAVASPAHPVFRQIANGAHPDFRRLARTPGERTKGLRKEIGVEQVREATDALRSTAALGGHRVLVVDWADELSANAANALLKLLEEPPAGAVLMLVAQRPGRMPRTVLSRCAILRLRPLPPAIFAEGLAKLAPGLDVGLGGRLAVAARGSLGRAFEMLRTGWLEDYESFLPALAEGGPGARLKTAERLAARVAAHGPEIGADPFRTLLERLARALAGANEPEIVEGERERLAALGAALGLDRTLASWDKLAALVAQIEALNLDALQGFLRLVEDVAAARGGPPGGRSPAPAHPS